MVAQYSQQEPDAIGALLGGGTNSSGAVDPMKELMDSIVSQIEEALSSADDQVPPHGPMMPRPAIPRAFGRGVGRPVGYHVAR